MVYIIFNSPVATEGGGLSPLPPTFKKTDPQIDSSTFFRTVMRVMSGYIYVYVNIS